MAATSSMFMYSLTVQPPTAITHALVGQFSGTKDQQILTASGSRLTLSTPDSIRGIVTPFMTHDVFGIIRGLASFRVAGGSKDYILVASDSGRIALIEYLPDENRFHRIHLETYGKSGIRRVIPGQYLAADPKGRACMIASVEKNKLVYVLNRNSQAELTISSPLEAHKPHALLFALIALDTGYENPIFAALEIDYSESDVDPSGQAYEDVKKELVYYELDLGLNHVVRKWSDSVDRTANLLLQVPGGADGPSGVLVCGEDSVTYRHSNQDAYRIAIPRRRGATQDPTRKRYIVNGVMHKLRGSFFGLLQTEDGDLFKLTFVMEKHAISGVTTGEVARIKMKFFDTVPVASSLLIMKNGFLFVAAENGNHIFYQFEKLADDDDEIEFTSDEFPADPDTYYEPAFFYPRPPENLEVSESINSLNPLMGLKAVNLKGDDAPELYAICGSGARSTFRNLRHGLSVTEIVESPLPNQPRAVWTAKLDADSVYDSYIVLSFAYETLVLSIGDNVEEASDTGFITTTSTLAVQQMGADSLIQVHPKGIQHISRDQRSTSWDVPRHTTIVAVSTNTQQVAIALSNGELLYFEMDAEGELREYKETRKMPAGVGVTALSMGEVPEGRQRSLFLAVGCDDATVRILSLDPESTLENKSVQALTAPPASLNIMYMVDSSSGSPTLYLHIGLYNGVYIRTVLDEITGELSDTRTRFLGARPVKLFRVHMLGQTAVLALSTKCWLGYSEEQTKMFTLTPLDSAPLENAWRFHSEQCPDGVVGFDQNYLRIFRILKLSNALLQEITPLQNTPRRFITHPHYPYFYVVESDYNTLSEKNRQALTDDAINGDAIELPPEEFGYPKADKHWASCIQVVNPLGQPYGEKGVISTVNFDEGETPLSIAAVPFASQDDEVFILVGTALNLVVSPKSCICGYLHVYRLHENGSSLEFIHKTKLDQPPLALLAFQGRVLAGVGPNLIMYDLGMRQMLRKSQALNVVPNLLTDLQSQGSRIVCSDVQESVSFVAYKGEDNTLIAFADDSVARWTTATTMVDYDTVAGGDKFGNLWLIRCPKKASDEADEDGAAGHLLTKRGYLGGTPNRLECTIHNYIQDIPTSFQKVGLVAGSREVLLYGGLHGTVGVLIPFESREDANFFQQLEAELRKEDGPLAGRDHLVYRGYYQPVKGVIDGDLCERYFQLPAPIKEKIAKEVDRSVREVARKIGEMRTKFAY